MRRATRKALAHLFLFGSILFLIIHLNRPSRTAKKFAWTTIRYKTTAATLPAPRGVCPGLAKSTKPALVVSRVTSEDTQWLDELAEHYHLCVYTADAPSDSNSKYLQVPANRGHESMAYLTFLIDNYGYISEQGAVFVHGVRWAWHNDDPAYDNVALLSALNISNALEPWGYHNLRCDWSVSTCPLSAPPQGSLETSLQAAMDPWDARAVSDTALPRALVSLFGGGEYALSGGLERLLLGRSDAVRAQCCAQFVVARENVWQHTRDEYVALRQWLLDATDSQNKYAAPLDDRISGRIVSYLWHILFMRQGIPGEENALLDAEGGLDLDRLNGQACPSAEECYCRLYGRCNLKGCIAPDYCLGQYSLPPNLKLPDDWAATHV
ncbi:uncharacterized protein K452DRAFT_172090 [Aplosporella prunicola CBS 121167]|uniref:Uncharacterized protein n=1 Tax=Aplosporella prunicola CBS 121167 TaxID=1176127 RepID=A0A6A6BHP9_9PEZI|nr:uncharacterized protein K452DRAFT_172090 [Aplosporella prunicola CBS 121167]KAF2143516.1 hypothetical protein K452DRAFT_172090 [Aplosporella prunicola CBS 121167]